MIWVIGGTKDSRIFLGKLLNINGYKEKIIVTTATDYGEKLLKELNVKTHAEKMDKEKMIDFVKNNNIDTIVDFSHPYAFMVSNNAIDISNKEHIKYFRFERQEIYNMSDNNLYFYSIEEIVEYISGLKENILVTLGSNSVYLFKNLKNLDNIYFRILPKWDIVKKCEDIGILPKNIIAMQGPFSTELNMAMIRQLDIKYMISKKSGSIGGELEKQKACDELGVKMIYFLKKELSYPNCYYDYNKLIDALVKNK